jgi:hypothetical protein
MPLVNRHVAAAAPHEFKSAILDGVHRSLVAAGGP